MVDGEVGRGVFLSVVKLFHPYKCRHCPTNYVILPGRFINSYLPVEIISGNKFKDSEFDKEKHTSHLLNCEQLQKQWNDVKKIIIAEQKKIDKLSVK